LGKSSIGLKKPKDGLGPQLQEQSGSKKKKSLRWGKKRSSSATFGDEKQEGPSAEGASGKVV